MEPTRRFWGFVGVFAGFLAVGVLADRPLLVVGAGTLFASLLAVQWRALTDFQRALDDLTVRVVAPETRTASDGTVPISVTARLPEPVEAPIRLSVGYGPGIDGPDDVVEIPPGETAADATHDVRFPVAGWFSVPDVECRLTDASGLVTETVGVDSAVAITVEPAEPTDVRVGVGQGRVAGTYGEHASGLSGSGLEPKDLREYLPGDSVATIDWKATARLNEPYVRGFEAETDRRTRLVVDVREPMHVGPPGRSKLAYLREVALGIVESAAAATDPVSLVIVDERGVHETRTTSKAAEYYLRIKRTLQGLGPVDQAGGRPPVAAESGPSEALSAAETLADRDSAFARTLRPYFAETVSYVSRLADDPLFEAARAAAGSNRAWTVVFTDDSDPRRTVMAAKAATRNENYVTVFLTPSVLFAEEGRIPPDEAHDRYVAFEELRRELHRLPRVTAFQVAPGDRLEAVVAASDAREPTDANEERPTPR